MLHNLAQDINWVPDDFYLVRLDLPLAVINISTFLLSLVWINQGSIRPGVILLLYRQIHRRLFPLEIDHELLIRIPLWEFDFLLSQLPVALMNVRELVLMHHEGVSPDLDHSEHLVLDRLPRVLLGEHLLEHGLFSSALMVNYGKVMKCMYSLEELHKQFLVLFLGPFHVEVHVAVLYEVFHELVQLRLKILGLQGRPCRRYAFLCSSYALWCAWCRRCSLYNNSKVYFYIAYSNVSLFIRSESSRETDISIWWASGLTR